MNVRRIAVVVAAAAGVSAAVAAAQPAASPPAFRTVACDLPGGTPDVAPRLTFGTGAVPRDRAHPERGTFDLAVVVVRSAQQPPQPDPVVYISGGPGSPLTRYAEYQARHPYAPARDLILVDQRGVGRSEPKLCPQATQDMLPAALAVAADPGPGSQARRRDVVLRCRDEARSRGIDPDSFGTATTVEDFDQVRQALGVTRWNVYGTSYGTTVAMTLMARHPGTIRAAVLDSLYPPDPLPPWSARVAEARDAFFAACRDDPACDGRFPDLAGQYRQALARLGQAAPSLVVPAAMRQPGNRIALTPSLFAVILAQRLYHTNSDPGLPGLIAAVRGGAIADAASALAAVLADAGVPDMPAHLAVECRDRPAFRDRAPDPTDVLDSFEPYGICAQWSDPGPPPLVPVGTAIPTLVLAGQFDPNLSPARSRDIAARIGARATWIEVPGAAHSVRAASPCVAAIASAFIDRPDQAPDTGCPSPTAPQGKTIPSARSMP